MEDTGELHDDLLFSLGEFVSPAPQALLSLVSRGCLLLMGSYFETYTTPEVAIAPTGLI